MVRTYKLYAAITATGSALAQVDIRRNGRILGVQISISIAVNPAAGDQGVFEVSLYPSVQTSVNDAMGVLAYGVHAAGILTSGALNASSVYKPVFGQQVAVGDRIYLHATEAGTQTYGVYVLVDVEEM